ncbi:MAG: hypothetical protein SGI74_00535 [Oligoflexia bacterium]|nr:hypothetical protein [Oligoflexia bacterium]
MKFLLILITFSLITNNAFATLALKPSCPRDVMIYEDAMLLCRNFDKLSHAIHVGMIAAHEASESPFKHLKKGALPEMQENIWFTVALDDCFGQNDKLKMQFLRTLMWGAMLGEISIVTKTALYFTGATEGTKIGIAVLRHLKKLWGAKGLVMSVTGGLVAGGAVVYKIDKKNLDKTLENEDATLNDLYANFGIPLLKPYVSPYPEECVKP